MENLLFDMVRADEMTAQYALKDSAYRHMGKHTDLYASIFQLHHTTKDAFKRSFRFYESHPEMMSQMINKLQQRAEKWYNSKTEYKNLKP